LPFLSYFLSFTLPPKTPRGFTDRPFFSVGSGFAAAQKRPHFSVGSGFAAAQKRPHFSAQPSNEVLTLKIKNYYDKN
jgi:hypothetical protein